MKKSILLSLFLVLFSVSYAQIETDGPLKIVSGYGYTQVGPLNSSFAHFVTDRPIYYFNKPITVNGAIGNYNSDLHLQAARSTKMVITTGGKVGIGTTSPVGKLNVIGSGSIGSGEYLDWGNAAVLVTQGSYRLGMDGNQITASDELFISSENANQYISFQIARDTKLKINGNGNIGIGTTNPTSKLTVKGEILCSKVRVVGISNIPDYVFEENYNLLNIDEVEDYISENKHLPEIPAASEFEEKGMDVVEMNKLLLKKLEEQTLYIIELNKRVKQLEDQNRQK